MRSVSMNRDLFDGVDSCFGGPASAQLPAFASAACSHDSGSQLDLFRDTPADQSRARLRRCLMAEDLAGASSERALLIGFGALSEAEIRDLDALEALIALRLAPDPRSTLEWLELELWPAAVRVLQLEAWPLVTKRLRSIGAALEAVAYDPEHPAWHASHVWLLLNDWERVRVAIEGEAGWTGCGARLALHARACDHTGRHERAWIDRCELCFAHAHVAEQAMSEDDAIEGYWNEFLDLDPELDVAAFPAWCRLLHGVPIALYPSNNGYGARLLRAASMLAAAPAGIPERRTLQQLEPALLTHWLAARAREAEQKHWP